MASQVLLAQLPVFGIPRAVEAGDYDDPALLNLEEYSIRETSYPGAAPSAMDDGKLQRVERYGLNGTFDCECETPSKVRAYPVVPRVCFPQIRVCFGQPDDRQHHGFLNRLALTLSQGMTSEGFCSWRATR